MNKTIYLHYDSWINATNGYGGPNGASLNYSKQLGWSNSVTGSVSLSKGTISGSVGFNVTDNGNSTAQYSISIPSGKHAQILWRNQYDTKSVTQTTYFVFNHVKYNQGTSVAYANRWNQFNYTYYYY